jgi:hypothetical protein
MCVSHRFSSNLRVARRIAVAISPCHIEPIATRLPTLPILALAGCLLCFGTLAGCGGGGNTGGSGSNTGGSGGTNSNVDPCLVGTWRSTNFTMSLSDTSPGLEAQGESFYSGVVGGAGEIFTVRPDGTFSDETKNMKPLTGTTHDGEHATVTLTGKAEGHLSESRNNFLRGTYESPALTATTAKNGSVVATERVQLREAGGYYCKPGGKLTTNGEGDGNPDVEYVRA